MSQQKVVDLERQIQVLEEEEEDMEIRQIMEEKVVQV
jgi:hypothetical protein